MNSIFCPRWESYLRIAISFGFFVVGLHTNQAILHAQSGSDAVAEFRRNVQELSMARLEGTEENELQMEKALSYLDTAVISALNSATSPNGDEINRRLAELVTHTPPVGENYRLFKLGGDPGVYALVVNFGLGGPAAVRIYAGPSQRFAFAAKIDHFMQKDFFDSDLELVPVSRTEPGFVIVSGRTDDLSTGLFSVWLFDGKRVTSVWSSDLLQQSKYATDEQGFHLAYCSRVDEDHPSKCLTMSHDLYRFQAGKWERVESASTPSADTAPK